MDEDCLPEIWNVLKEYIPAKDRQTAADHWVSSLIDLGVADETLTDLGKEDPQIRSAVADAIPDDDLVDDEDEYGDE
jgi:hypothetical protein|tara:strand:+ start:21899 stop:22129 length:231 start_codon:yes stop_codon:yes gene_type:complete